MRQLSGAKFVVTVLEILEATKKTLIISYLIGNYCDTELSFSFLLGKMLSIHSECTFRLQRGE